MSYSAGETLIFAKVKACTGFGSTNVSRGNWQMLNKGASDHYAIIHIGTTSVRFVTTDHYQARYITIVELWQRYEDDGTSLTNLYGHLDNLMAGMQPYPRMGDTAGTVIDANIVTIGQPEEMWASGGGPAWLRIQVSLEWLDEIDVTIS